jgi:hypothetical protein
VDNICWEADYPHFDSMWQSAPEQLHEVLTDNSVPDDEINKITYQNAMRWYHFDPFTTSPPNKPPSAPDAKPPKATTSPSEPSPTTKRARAETHCTRRRGNRATSASTSTGSAGV